MSDDHIVDSNVIPFFACNVLDSVNSVVDTGSDSVKSMVGTMLDSVKSMVGTMLDSVKSMVGTVSDSILSIELDCVTWFASMVHRYWGGQC